MHYNEISPTRHLFYQRPELLYRLLFLLTGSIITLILFFNLLTSTKQANIAPPISTFTELGNIIHDSVATVLPKKANPVSSAPQQTIVQTPKLIAPTPSWHTLTILKQQTLSDIFQHLQLNQHDLRSILALPQAYSLLSRLATGGTLKIEQNRLHQVMRLVYQFAKNKTLIVTRVGDHFQTETVLKGLERRLKLANIPIQNTLYNSIRHAGLSASYAMDLANIFGQDINFRADIHNRANVKLIYQEYYKQGQPNHTGHIVAAEIINRGKSYQAIRHITANGYVGYYTPKGVNLQKAFLRAPVHYKYVSSPFSLRRYHPILHTRRPHYGVDLAALRGTPIVAASDGVITFIGRKGGFGNCIIIQHNHKYTTLYGHMEKFAKGMKKGGHVHEQEVIGYVGMTGLATGPHLHYEFRINGKPANPMTVKLPQGKPIAKADLSHFKAYARRLVAIMNA